MEYYSPLVAEENSDTRHAKDEPWSQHAEKNKPGTKG